MSNKPEPQNFAWREQDAHPAPRKMRTLDKFQTGGHKNHLAKSLLIDGLPSCNSNFHTFESAPL